MPSFADHVTATFEVLLICALNCCVPPDSTVADNGVTLTVTAPGLATVIGHCNEPEREFASLTDTVNMNDPACVGIPEMVPVDALMFKPGGSCPDVIENLYGAVPPLTLIDPL